ncbi:MAG TPA: outer membrane protein assembly factor BamA [Verrucomicrobiae bacterium]|nr:outer membrane protein assembly factor BamA [Verrucomicrobiae bacterium]
MRRLLWGLVILAVSIQQQTRAQEEAPIVREIEVRFDGPETVSKAIVLANIQTAVGQPRSRDLIEQDVRNLINTGYFSDVRVLEEPVADGVKITFQVHGKATIKEVVFVGEKRFKEDRLRRESSQKAGDILNERTAHADALKMEEMYQKAGYPDAKVDVLVSIDKDTGKAILTFKVTEGDRVFIKAIKIAGNKAYPTARLLKIIKTKARWWGSFLAGSGVLKDEQFKEDLEKLRDFYRSNGYIDMEIRTNYVQRVARQWIDIHIDIFEGQQYKVGTISIEGNKLFPTIELERRLKMTTGKVFTPDGLSKDMKSIEDYYGARGYLDTTVRPTRIPNVETGRIDITYSVHEGELTYIEMIRIRGNTKTKDKVIRRELAVVPGDIYNTVRVEASKERLKNLGYFSKVETTPEPTPIPNHKDLVIDVEEQRTGTVTFGAGFSSIDNLLGFVEVTQGNFDLFNWPNFTGGGEKLRLRAQLGLERQDYILSFVEPWFLDRRLLLGVDLFHTEASYLSTEYTEQSTGGSLRLEKALSEFLRAGVKYSLQSISLDVDNNASQELQSQNGTQLQSSLEATLTYDTRDSVFLTHHGNRTELSAELAGGPLGADVSVYKLTGQTTFYFPLFGTNQILQLLAATGVVQAYGGTFGSGPVVDEDPSPFVDLVKVDDVPIFDRFFLGGANTMRGFGFQKVGPKDVNNDPIGGNTKFNGTAEYTFPIVERVRGAVFYDVGQVWENSYQVNFGTLLYDAGIGMRLNLPIGPVRLDYGYPLKTDRGSGHSGKFQFSVGYQF